MIKCKTDPGLECMACEQSTDAQIHYTLIGERIIFFFLFEFRSQEVHVIH